MSIRWMLSMTIAAAIGFWGATPDAHGQHAAAGGAGGLGALSGLAGTGTGGTVSGSFFGYGYAASGGYGGYGMWNAGMSGWGQGSPYGGYYNPMMMNQAAMMGGGFPATMTPLAGPVPNGAGVNPSSNPNANPRSRTDTAAKPKATKSRTKTTKKR